MIPHPTVESLLAKHGTRAEARKAMESYILAVARREAQTAGRSMRCAGGDCAGINTKYGRVGCSNDGSTCICECHDNQGATK